MSPTCSEVPSVDVIERDFLDELGETSGFLFRSSLTLGF